MQKIRAIFFDLDNTLIDFMRMKEESCKAAVQAMVNAGLKMDQKEAFCKIQFTINVIFICFRLLNKTTKRPCCSIMSQDFPKK